MMHNELVKHSDLVWAATELTKAWVGKNTVAPDSIVSTFNQILKGIHPAVKASAEDIKS